MRFERGLFGVVSIAFVLFTALKPSVSFASRGLYFSVSKINSAQKNTISDYQQNTAVSVSMASIVPANTVNTSTIAGQTFDYTTGNTGKNNYSTLYNALNSTTTDKKYIMGDVTFTLQPAEKSTITYTATSGGTINLTDGTLTAKTGITTGATADEGVAISNTGSSAMPYIATTSGGTLTSGTIGTSNTQNISIADKMVTGGSTVDNPSSTTVSDANLTITGTGTSTVTVNSVGGAKTITALNANNVVATGGTTTSTTNSSYISTYTDINSDGKKTVNEYNLVGTEIVSTNNSTIVVSSANQRTDIMNGTLDTTKTATATSVTCGTSCTSSSTVTDIGIDMYTPLLSQTAYLSSPYTTAVQNLRIDPTKIGSSWSIQDATLVVNEVIALFTNKESTASSFSSNLKNVIQYDDNGTLLLGQAAINKLNDAFMKPETFSHASIIDANYTANVIEKNVVLYGNKIGSSWQSWTGSTDVGGVLSQIMSFGPITQRSLENIAMMVNATNKEASAANLAEYSKNADGTYSVTLSEKDWSYEIGKVKSTIASEIATTTNASHVPTFNTNAQMQSFVNALSGQSSDGFEASIGYKFRMFRSAFFAAPQLDLTMFRNTTSTISGKNQTNTADTKTYTYGNLDASYAGSLVGKFGYENKLRLGQFKIPFSVYGFGGGTSALTSYRNAKSQNLGIKYGLGAEVFVSRNLALFGEMFWINFLKQNVNYDTSNSYTASTTVANYINSQYGTTITLDNSYSGTDNKNMSIKSADLNQVLDINGVTYTKTEQFSNISTINGVKFGLTYYVE